ncbi:DUF4143 domain-containing protein, partial [bacterium]|nr:DUF4143 domain-containing protein [bacterium]
FFSVETKETLGLLHEYMTFGGYPRVVIEKEMARKVDAVDEIYRSYVDKDIRFLGVEKLDAFRDLLRILAGQIGNVANYTELSRTLNISIPTVKNYLRYMEKTYVAEKITPHACNIRKEITRSPVWYFADCGLRNHALRIFGNVPPGEEGFLFENVVYLLLKEKVRETFGDIHFWRTIDGAEVDFVVAAGKDIFPIEVKYTSLNRPTVERSLRSFIEKYAPPKAYIVNKNFSAGITIGDTEVRFVSFSEFARKDFFQENT